MKHLYSFGCFRRLKQQRLAVLVASFFTAMSVWSQDVTCNQARGIAADFFKSHGIKSENVVQKKAKQKAPGTAEGNSAYYIFNSNDTPAFVIVSGDSRTQKVLAYSTEAAFDEDNIAPGAAYMLEQYEAYINGLQDGTCKPMAKVSIGRTSGKLIETALWNQSYNFWWAECPVVGGKNTHAGCIATAMAILMRHYEWPLRGYGNKSYTTSTLGLNLSADFDEIEYNWASLPKGNQSDAGWNSTNQAIVAKLLKQCGVAANMDYGTEGSGANYIGQSVALFRYFGYTLGSYIAQGSVSEAEWYDYIINEIDSNNPVLYDGKSDEEGGHAFVCDGYDTDGKLHFNFGWSGASNGYYAILSADMKYRNNQGILVGVRPADDAGSRVLPDFHMSMTDAGTPNGLAIDGDGTIHRGQSFTAKAYKFMNVADKNMTFSLALFICDKDGGRKLKVGEYAGIELNSGYSYNWLSVRGSIPYDYTVDDNDYLYMFSSTDGGTTWNKVTCYDPQFESIKLADVYDNTPSHLRMTKAPDLGIGLTVADGSTVNVKDMGFTVTANCLQNILSQAFTGEVAVFLCDNGGRQKQKIGTTTMSGLGSGYYYYAWNISCMLTKESGAEAGDRLYLFSRLDGEEEWASVVCNDPDKAYIEITEETMHATPQHLKMIVQEGKGTGLALADGNAISMDGQDFYIVANCLKNILPKTFTGEVAAFICDSEGKQIAQVGTSTISELPSPYYYPRWSVKCNIPGTIEVVKGDRLCVYTKYQGDDAWSMVTCDVPEKAYIEIPEELIPATKAIAFSTPYATFCSRHNLDFSAQTDVYAYRAANVNAGSIALERVMTVKAGEGVLLRGIAMSDGAFHAEPATIETVEETEENLFVGVLEETTVRQDDAENTNYVLGMLDGNIGFYKANGVTLRYGQAYLAVPDALSHAPQSLGISFSDKDITGIIGTEAAPASVGTADIYTLQGIKASKPQHGIYIINGKKTIKR